MPGANVGAKPIRAQSAYSDWTPGDVVVQMFRIEIANRADPAPYWMHVGMYTYPALTVELVLDADGRPPMQAVVLGPNRRSRSDPIQITE